MQKGKPYRDGGNSMSDTPTPDPKRLHFLNRGSTIELVMCKCGRRMGKFGWVWLCPAKEWFNFFLHVRRT